MSKYKIFHEDVSIDWRRKDLESKVNKFLDSHKIISVKTNNITEKVETWFYAGLSNVLSYIIEYEEENKGENK